MMLYSIGAYLILGVTINLVWAILSGTIGTYNIAVYIRYRNISSKAFGLLILMLVMWFVVAALFS